MKTAINEHLAALYGEDRAAALAPRLRQLLEKYPALKPAERAGGEALPLTQRDALLITYGDQVREDGVPPLQTLTAFCEQHLRGTVSGVHILPFYPFTSDDGFSVTDFFAVDSALGTWQDVRRLASSFDLMFDAVFNHMSAESEWFQKFLADDPVYRDFFVSVEGEPDLSQVIRPRALPLLTQFQGVSGAKNVWTTFSADQVDVNIQNPEVLLALMDALLFYVSQGAKFVRLDAIAFLWKEIGTTCLHLPQTHRVIQLMRAVLEEAAPGVMLITETNVPHLDNISYFGDGTNEAHLVYNFALPPLVLHSLATGNAEKLTRWAQSLKLPSDRVTFFNFLASHDGIGVNPARGILREEEIDALVARTLAHGGFISYKNMPDGSKVPYEMNIVYFDALNNPAADESVEVQVNRFVVSQAIMLSLAGVPGIYFHSLFGSRNDRQSALDSEINRRINRQKFTRAELETELSDDQSLRSRVLQHYKTLLSARQNNAAFSPLAGQEILSGDGRVFAVLRGAADSDEWALCLHNVSNEPVTLEIEPGHQGAPENWIELLSESQRGTSDQGKVLVALSAYEVNWFSSRGARPARLGVVK
ncbi:MAG TPA: sugar phosphorylase [Methylomirabilota bacterium]|nr:sugar phosphorylase [Methylomirabilota bacterium]